MNGKLPIELENLELPVDKFNKLDSKKNQVDVERVNGYVSIAYLLSLIITLGSILAIMFMGNR